MSSFTTRKLFQDHTDGELFNIAVGLGMVAGWRGFRKFGRNDDADAGTEEMWELGTTRVLPTSAGALSVVSTSINDDLGNTGAETLTVQGLDSNYDEIEETITMDGTTPVASASSDWFRVNRAFAVSSGSAETNVGNITISIGGNAQAFIEADEGQTHQSHYTVPAGHTLLITGQTITTGTLGAGHAIIEAQVKLVGESWRSISAVDMADGQTYPSHHRGVTEALPEKSEIRQRIIFSGTNGELAGVYHGYLIDNSVL